jgi:hypothetical protein
MSLFKRLVQTIASGVRVEAPRAATTGETRRPARDPWLTDAERRRQINAHGGWVPRRRDWLQRLIAFVHNGFRRPPPQAPAPKWQVARGAVLERSLTDNELCEPPTLRVPPPTPWLARPRSKRFDERSW